LPLYTAIPPAEGRRQLRQWRFALGRAAGLLVITLLGCMVGLLLLDRLDEPLGARAFRALWNAANTISTLGDLDSLNDDQQWFMIGAMFTLVTVGGFAISNLTGILSAGDVQAYREYRRVERKLEGLSGHVLVAGYGVFGRRVADRMRKRGRTVVVLEYEDDRAKQASDAGYISVLLVAGRNEALSKVGLGSAAAMFILVANPDRKLALTLIARSINAGLPIIVADDSDTDETWAPHAGASRVVLVDDLVAEAMVDQLEKLQINT
jgi:voltage-gated potassium channel